MKKNLLKYLLFISSFCSANAINAQISAGPDNIQTCPGQTLNLTASVAVGLGSNVSTDDRFSGVQNIGFTFNYFGQNYTQFVVSGNNIVSFDLSLANQYSDWTYAGALASGDINNAILYPFQDAYPNSGDQISVITFGPPGRRICVIQACQVPLFSCSNLLSSSQVVLYEGSNIIDINILDKPGGCTWNSGTGVIGIRYNTVEVLAPGRNLPNINWSEQYKSYRFTPNAAGSYTMDTIPYVGQKVVISPDANRFFWYKQGDTVNTIGVGPNISVQAEKDVAYYVAKYHGDGLCNSPDTVLYYDTVFVNFKNFKSTQTIDICAGQTYNFFGQILARSGTYSNMLTSSEGCDSLYEINLIVNPLPEIVLNASGTLGICEGLTKSVKNTTGKDGETYQWYKDGNPISGENKVELVISEAGSYQLEATNPKGCKTLSRIIEAVIHPNPIAEIESIGDGSVKCTYDTVLIVATYNKDYEYYWWPETALRAHNTELYAHKVKGVFREPHNPMSVTIKNQYGCVIEKKFEVNTKPCCEIFIPNAFTPNGDGNNDRFTPVLQLHQNILQFVIFDRNGTMVYESTKNSDGWDGNYSNGKPADAGVYMYQVTYTCDDGKNYTKKESVTLLR